MAGEKSSAIHLIRCSGERQSGKRRDIFPPCSCSSCYRHSICRSVSWTAQWRRLLPNKKLNKIKYWSFKSNTSLRDSSFLPSLYIYTDRGVVPARLLDRRNKSAARVGVHMVEIAWRNNAPLKGYYSTKLCLFTTVTPTNNKNSNKSTKLNDDDDSKALKHIWILIMDRVKCVATSKG